MSDTFFKRSKKSPLALRTIGEVAEQLTLEPHVLRFWESRFSQIQPQKRRGRRYYRPEDIVLLQEIKHLLYEQGYTIKGAQQFLEEKNMKPDEKQTDLFIPSRTDDEPGLKEKDEQFHIKEVLPVTELREILETLHKTREVLGKAIAGNK